MTLEIADDYTSRSGNNLAATTIFFNLFACIQNTFADTLSMRNVKILVMPSGAAPDVSVL